MLPDERKREIIDLITSNDGCSVGELAEELNHSKPTIRRDLDELAEQNIIERTYGGAVPVIDRAGKYEQRKIRFQEAKAAIGERAVEEIHEGQTVFFDSGSTTLEVSRRVPDELSFVVVTNNPSVGYELANNEARVELTGGHFLAEHRTLQGPRTERDIERLNINLLFLGTDGVHPEAGLSALNDNQARIKELMIDNAQRVVVVADHSKIGNRGFVDFADLEEVDCFITDSDVPAPLREALADASVETVSGLAANDD